jgi:bifunctional UDP-N-acetylglucosamine pyrophosphorylase/glucosamine-1-phosphate N-acetyltransferase
MRSDRPKVLHELAGKPLLAHVLDAVGTLEPVHTIVVVGHGADEVEALVGTRARCVLQRERLGTGHAVQQVEPELRRFSGDVMVLCGDVPLLTPKTLRSLLATHRRAKASATVLTMTVSDPTGYGRVVCANGGSLRIVEHRDATARERAICEVNTGTYCFDARFLFTALGQVGRDNSQREYYLTDVVAAASKRRAAGRLCLDDAAEGVGVNSRADLASAERTFQRRLIDEHMNAGVTFLDPATTYLSAGTRIGRDTTIGPNVRLAGATQIGSGCTLEGASYLADTTVGDGALLRWGVVADRATIGPDARVGPYAHLRPQAVLAEEVHIGNFVEVKNATIGRKSKANHLSYIGDATVGCDANVGAGTITCNYDGYRKHRTEIGDRVQIGSDTQLVAPVRLGDDAYVAAGSTVTKDVEPGALAFNEKPQVSRPGWVASFRKRARRGSTDAPARAKKR